MRLVYGGPGGRRRRGVRTAKPRRGRSGLREWPPVVAWAAWFQPGFPRRPWLSEYHARGEPSSEPPRDRGANVSWKSSLRFAVPWPSTSAGLASWPPPKRTKLVWPTDALPRWRTPAIIQRRGGQRHGGGSRMGVTDVHLLAKSLSTAPPAPSGVHTRAVAER